MNPFILYADFETSPVNCNITWKIPLGTHGDRWGLWIGGKKLYPCRRGDPAAVVAPSPEAPPIPLDATRGADLVFTPQFMMLRGTVRKLGSEAAQPPSLAPLEGQPGLYRLCGRVIKAPIHAHDAWLLDCGVLAGFTFDDPPAPVLPGDLVTAEAQLRACGGWTDDEGLAHALQRHEGHVPRYRWRVEEFGWPPLDPYHPEQKAIIRTSFRNTDAGLPQQRLVCRRLASMKPSTLKTHV